jgi:hypothetical protein
MPTNILTDAKLWAGQYAIHSYLNEIRLTVTPQLKDDTTFGATYQTSKGGGALIRTELKGSGFVDTASGIESVVIPSYAFAVGSELVPITVAAEGGDAGEGCRFFKSGFESYDAHLQIGELHKFNFNSKGLGQSGDNPLVRGTIMEDGKTSRTGNGNTATRTLGAISATQKMYASLHLIAFNGTNVDFVVKSAVTDFATTTDRFAFTQLTAIGSEYLTPPVGAVTDTFWRVYWTGTFTSFSAVISLGIQ